MKDVSRNRPRGWTGALIALLVVLVGWFGAGTAGAHVRGFQAPTAAASASFIVSSPDVSGGSITFDGSASTPTTGFTITDYSWDFGDGTTFDSLTSPTTTHTYSSGGSFTATLTITDSSTATATSPPQTITVTQATAPTPSFTASSPQVSGGAITFTSSAGDSNPGAIPTYSWNFGDGGTSTLANPTHTYAAGGSYTVTLTVSDQYGQSGTSSQPPITVTQAVPPTAAFTLPASGVINSPVSFDASSSTDPNPGATPTYSWDFGDGTTGTGVTAGHTYTTAGTYTVTLTVSDQYGQTNSVSHSIAVGTGAAPIAVFTPPSGGPASPLSFDGSGSTDPNPGVTITTYAWNFGDGTTGTGATATHAYGAPGNYVVTLTVTDSNGNSGSVAHTVTVSGVPMTAVLNPSTSTPLVGEVVGFSGSRIGDPNDPQISYAWRFGDGVTSHGANATHVYQVSGTYTVVLTVNGLYGSASTSHVIHVAPIVTPFTAPTAVFSTPTGRAGKPVSFNGSNSTDPNAGGTLAFRWTFGDGGVAAGPHASHTFRAGTWTVTLTVTDDVSGLSDSVSHRLTIAPPGACIVPRLKGLTVKQARRLIRTTTCRMGHLIGPAVPTTSPGKGKKWRMVVVRQSPAAGTVAREGTKVPVHIRWRAMK